MTNGKDAFYEILRQSIWAAPDVSVQPVVRLARWRVVQVQTQDLLVERHFVGYNLEDREGRVSSAIQELDTERGRGVTRSGRVYELVGPPGYDTDGEWVWHNWARMKKFCNEKDVTEEVAGGLLEKGKRQ